MNPHLRGFVSCSAQEKDQCKSTCIKAACKLLMKLIPGADFTSVLCKKTDGLAVFFVLFGSVHIKAVHKTLVKLTPGVNFINIFTCSFYTGSSPKCKNSVKSSESFYAFGIYVRKSCM